MDLCGVLNSEICGRCQDAVSSVAIVQRSEAILFQRLAFARLIQDFN